MSADRDTTMREARRPSYWLEATAAGPTTLPLEGDAAADICIAGAGLTGLWSAYYLKKALPDASIVVLDKHYAGYGASGRNAGWLTSEFNGKFSELEARGGAGAAVAMHEAMCHTVDEVIAVCELEGIDAEVRRGGAMRFAQNEPQLVRLKAAAASRARRGANKGYSWLSAADVVDRVRIEGVRAAEFTEYGARVHPAKLVAGLLEVVRRLGVRVHEGTAVTDIQPGRVVTDRGTVRAPIALRCMEAYTRDLPGLRRTWLPLHSSGIVTEVLPDDIWEEIGWDRFELIADGLNAYGAAQRTLDGRILFGARGARPRYRLGSALTDDGRVSEDTVKALKDGLDELLPQTKSVPVAEAWCGVLAVPRDWSPTVTFDPTSGTGWAGGYVGSGVSTTNLAARTFVDLIAGRHTELTGLPWVGHNSRKWEPEPIRWMGVRSMSALFAAADRRESADGRRPSKLSTIGRIVSGR